MKPDINYFKNSGRMKPNLIYVDSHISDVPHELHKIDPELFVMFNPDTQKYEIHRNRLGIYTLELNLPYKELDYRAVIALKNAMDERIMEKIDAENEKIKSDHEKKAKDEMNCKLGDVYTYCKRHEDKEYIDKNAYDNRWV